MGRDKNKRHIALLAIDNNHLLMNKEKFRKGLFYLIPISLLLIYIVPYAKVFYPDETGRTSDLWVNVYLWDDEILIFIYPFYTLVWILFLSFKHTKFIGLLLGLISILCFLYTILSASIPIQDFIPGYGLLIAAIHHLIMIIYLYFDFKFDKSIVSYR